MRNVVLFDLPTELVLELVWIWIADLSDLSKLDLACSNRSARDELLAILGDNRFCVENHHPRIVQDTSYVAWLSSRKVHAAKLVLKTSSIAVIASIAPLRLINVQTVAFDDDMGGLGICNQHCTVLFRSLPALTCLDFEKGWHTIAETDIVIFTGIQMVNLKQLHLNNCWNLADRAVIQLAIAFRHTLEILHANWAVLTNHTMQVISTFCSKLVSVNLCCHGVSASAVLGLCQSCRSLRNIYLGELCSPGGDAVIASIITLPANLEVLFLPKYAGTTCRSLDAALSRRSSMLAVRTADYYFSKTKVTNQSAEFDWHSKQPEQCILDTMSRTRLTVTSLSVCQQNIFSPASWCTAANRHGNYLEKLRGVLGDAISDDTVSYVAISLSLLWSIAQHSQAPHCIL